MVLAESADGFIDIAAVRGVYSEGNIYHPDNWKTVGDR